MRQYTNVFEHIKYGCTLYGGAYADNELDGIVESAKSTGLQVTKSKDSTLRFYLPVSGYAPESDYKLR